MKLQPVIWSKGTFLTPQHFQAQERFLESQLHFKLDALNFRPWGFSRLSIDQQALATGDFSIVAAAGVFPMACPLISRIRTWRRNQDRSHPTSKAIRTVLMCIWGYRAM